ncbi:MAG: hypothetical protein Q8K64_08155 [Sediminibacterium sp.]|nr:hypothetical protein [Sediminibacterium sp.]
MCEVIDAKVEFKNFFILLTQNSWFNKIANGRELEKIVSTCNKNENDNWQYNLIKFEFKNINIDRHTRPLIVNKLVKSGDGTASAFLSVSCNCDSINKTGKIEDPIKTLSTKIVLQFEFINEEDPYEVKILQSSWHLDKHDETKKTESSHPLYHYEFGGSEIVKNSEFDFGDFFLIDSPRLMHPPLDLILAIDFIIKNYYKEEDHSNLTGQGLYKRYIKNAQTRVWRPYAISFASNFYEFDKNVGINTAFARNILHCG